MTEQFRRRIQYDLQFIRSFLFEKKHRATFERGMRVSICETQDLKRDVSKMRACASRCSRTRAIRARARSYRRNYKTKN